MAPVGIGGTQFPNCKSNSASTANGKRAACPWPKTLDRLDLGVKLVGTHLAPTQPGYWLMMPTGMILGLVAYKGGLERGDALLEVVCTG